MKSVKVNMVLNTIKGAMGVLFPLITFPYITGILGVDNVGKYNFSNSIISYFVLLAGLGISTYAVREGAGLREDRIKSSLFIDEMFSINVLSTIISYIVLFICVLLIPKLHNYKVLLIILSIQVAFKTLGIEWVYSIYEDYLYITIRSILFQFLSLILLFVFVKSENDLNVYAGITVVSAVGSNFLNFIHAKKYCDIRIVSSINWKKHMKPILVLFAMAVTVTIYVSADTTMLGFMCGDYTVGIYSVSTKVYTIVKTVLSSVLVVSIPRLAAFLSQKRFKEFNDLASDVYSTLISLVVPAITGIIALRLEIVQFISNEEYIKATSSLSILSVALLFCLGAWFWGQCILVPEKREKDVFNVTIISAFSNILLNFFLIPLWEENAAALTTVIAEAISFFWCWYKGRKYAKLKKISQVFFKVLLGCGSIYLVIVAIGLLNLGRTLHLILSIIIALIVYFVVEIALKNESLLGLVDSLFGKIKKHKPQ